MSVLERQARSLIKIFECIMLGLDRRALRRGRRKASKLELGCLWDHQWNEMLGKGLANWNIRRHSSQFENLEDNAGLCRQFFNYFSCKYWNSCQSGQAHTLFGIVSLGLVTVIPSQSSTLLLFFCFLFFSQQIFGLLRLEKPLKFRVPSGQT